MNIRPIIGRKKVGNLGELLVSRYLEGRGFKLITKNYQRPWGEIDLVLIKEGITHFIEVKSVSCCFEDFPKGKSRTDEYRPEDNVHPQKLKRLSRVIQTYLAEKGEGIESNWQFDVATVYLDRQNKKAKIALLENLILS